MLDRFIQFLHRLYLVYINTLHTATLLIITCLAIASGYTTFKGMVVYINEWIALIITIAVQIVIILSAYALSVTYRRAHRLRFVGLIVSLLIGLVVSINFTYIMFHQKSQAKAERTERFKEMDAEIKDYIMNVDSVKSNMIKAKMDEIKRLEEKYSQAFDGTLEEMPLGYKIPGFGHFAKMYKEELEKARVALREFRDELDEEFAEYENLKQDFLNNAWKVENMETDLSYKMVTDSFTKLTSKIDNTLVTLGHEPINRARIMVWEDFIKSDPPHAFSTNLALYLAIIIDLLTFIFSFRLRILPIGELSNHEKELACHGVMEFSDIALNSHDQIEVPTSKTVMEIGYRHNEEYKRKYWTRMFVLGMLLNKGYLRRVDENHVEFSYRFYNIVSSQLTHDNQPQNEEDTTPQSSEPKRDD